MSILIKGFSKKDFDELVQYARYGANNCMIGENTEVIEIPPHGDLIDRDELLSQYGGPIWTEKTDYAEGLRDVVADIKNAPTVIEAEEVYNKYTDTAGKLHWTGTHSGEHIIPADGGET